MNTHAASTPKRAFLWAAGLSTALAVLNHGYLLREHYQLHFGESSGQGLCNVSETFNCAAVSASSYAQFLGVPMALWGLLVNLALLGLIAWTPFVDDVKRAAHRRNLLTLSGAVALASIVMGAISSFVIQRYCPMCILAYVLSFVTFITLWLGVPKPAPGKSAALTAPRTSAKDFVPLLVVLAVVFVAANIANDQLAKSYGATNIDRLVKDAVADWQAAPKHDIKTFEPLVKGAAPEAAKMSITEFADFRCIHCRHAAPVLKAFVQSHPDVRIEFQAWPLDGECNTSMKQANGASCLLARAVYCANKQNKGWAAHDWVFENMEKWGSVDQIKGGIPELATAIGASSADLETCASAPETKDAIEKQAAVGTSLSLTGTPSIFVNGKKLPAGQSLPVLNEVYRQLAK